MFVYTPLRALIAVLLLLLCQLALAGVPANAVRIHYNRIEKDYDGWGLHVWGNDLDLVTEVTWRRAMKPAGQDDFGVYWDIPVKPEATEFGFIIHRADIKNVAKDMKIILNVHGHEIWQLEDDPVVYTSRPSIAGAAPDTQTSTPAPAPIAVAPAKPAHVAPLQTPMVGNNSSDLAALALMDRLRRETEARLQTEAQNEAKLQADLSAEQQARQTAEELLRRKEQALQQNSDVYKQREKDLIAANDNLEQKLEQGATRPAAVVSKSKNWPWMVACAVLALFGIGGLLWQRQRTLRLQRELTEHRNQLAKTADMVKKEAEERQQAEQRILQLANYDELTGLPNRAILNQTVTQALAKTKRYKKQLALLFIDLDRFKLINDTLGHGAGDFVLKTVAERFRECLRESDTVARLGGDEFVVLVEDLVDTKYVGGVAHKLVIAAQKPFMIEGQEFHVTASIGIATYPNDGTDSATLLKNADIAMYRAKEQGKNNFQYYSEQMNMHSLQRLALESSLRHALERNELRLHYQPIIDTVSKHISGVEALVRWQHPDMGMVGPLQFIPIAEETGMIADIGRWVLENACIQGALWHQAGFPLRMSINLSPRQLNEANLLDEFRHVLASTRFPASSLTVEITEGMMMTNPDETVVVLQALKDMGMQIAVDDFGTGYSSLAYLKRFPIDTLKIDRSFLQDIPRDQDDAALTGAVIAMGHSLRLNVVAEGIETDEQWQFLVDHKCQQMQGYWFCRPKAADDITEMLRQETPAKRTGTLA